MPFTGKTPARPSAAKSPTFTSLELHQQASNAIRMAAYYIGANNVPGAARKAVQALAALNQLRIAGFGTAANDAQEA